MHQDAADAVGKMVQEVTPEEEALGMIAQEGQHVVHEDGRLFIAQAGHVDDVSTARVL